MNQNEQQGASTPAPPPPIIHKPEPIKFNLEFKVIVAFFSNMIKLKGKSKT